MLVQDRYDYIENKLKQHKNIVLKTIAQELEVSHDTIRRDFIALEKKGVLKRIHGGAIRAKMIYKKSVTNVAFDDRFVQHNAQKIELANKTLTMVKEGQVIALNSGSTTYEVAQVLAAHYEQLTVFTNSLPITQYLLANTKFSVFLLGGFVNANEQALYNHGLGSTFPEAVNFDVAFITTSAISLENGVTDYRLQEKDVMQFFLGNAQLKVSVSDSSKFETIAYIKVCEVHDFHIIVTDSQLKDDIIRQYSEAGVQVI